MHEKKILNALKQYTACHREIKRIKKSYNMSKINIIIKAYNAYYKINYNMYENISSFDILVVKQGVILHIDSKATVLISSYFGHCINTWYSSSTL